MSELERKRFLAKIASLYYLEGLTQQNIANKLNISRTKVSRYLTRARKEGIAEIKINYPVKDFSSLEYQIEKKYRISECIIAGTFESSEATIEAMSGSLNNLLSRILKDGSHIGIGWGRSLREMSKYINVMEKSDIKVIPMIGGLGKTGTGVHTNSVAKNIADRMNGISYMIHSPAVLDNREAKEIVEKDSNVSEIMEMSSKIDTAIIGISDLGMDSTLIKTDSFTSEDYKYLESLGVVGDVNLIFIDENGNHVPNKIDDRIVRVPLEGLKKIAHVIGVAFGKRKLKVLLGALRSQIINVLFTDEETAIEIIKAG
ncbi:MAG: sugar-binding transcriptional regulator [Candidatus Humimicrobiaceae bacterium]